MNVNKSLVIATGYRKKFVDINEILEGYAKGDTSSIKEEQLSSGGTIFYTEDEQGNKSPIGTTKTLTTTFETTPDTVNEGDNIILIPLDPTQYYVIQPETTTSIKFIDVEGGNYLNDKERRYIPIIGRFTAPKDDYSVKSASIIATNEGNNGLALEVYGYLVNFATSNPDIEEGHTYEYNIFDGVCNIIDVTVPSITINHPDIDL